MSNAEAPVSPAPAGPAGPPGACCPSHPAGRSVRPGPGCRCHPWGPERRALLRGRAFSLRAAQRRQVGRLSLPWLPAASHSSYADLPAAPVSPSIALVALGAGVALGTDRAGVALEAGVALGADRAGVALLSPSLTISPFFFFFNTARPCRPWHRWRRLRRCRPSRPWHRCRPSRPLRRFFFISPSHVTSSSPFLYWRPLRRRRPSRPWRRCHPWFRARRPAPVAALAPCGPRSEARYSASVLPWLPGAASQVS